MNEEQYKFYEKVLKFSFNSLFFLYKSNTNTNFEFFNVQLVQQNRLEWQQIKMKRHKSLQQCLLRLFKEMIVR